jgi:hypothetical protein
MALSQGFKVVAKFSDQTASSVAITKLVHTVRNAVPATTSAVPKGTTVLCTAAYNKVQSIVTGTPAVQVLNVRADVDALPAVRMTVAAGLSAILV